ncbi:MAG: hypothetical protein RLT05_19230, partial [Bauldia litoralis]
DRLPPESLDTIVLRAVRAARDTVARTPETRLTVHLSSAAAGHWTASHLAPAIAELEAGTGIAPVIAAHEDWPDARVEIGTD